MKLVLFLVLALIVVINANFLSRTCHCKAVSDTVHFPFHSWDISSCKFCSCNDASMTNCQSACQTMVESYAKSGCGKVTKGSKVKVSHEASTCNSGIGSEVFQCA